MMTVNHESPAVHNYLSILQTVISRMASNSAGCKTWCITLVSAMVVVIANIDKHDYIWIGLVPIVLFFFLDSYYLGLERRFRALYNDFVRKLHADNATNDDLFIVRTGDGFKDSMCSTFKACVSMSIMPFYGLLALMLVIVRVCIL
ncbi:MAG: hypothetical protein JRJ77_09420 [Deltaproteobacteria bacterium]|nr:hypothetical protein [Deltaproteobacteria bacterium]